MKLNVKSLSLMQTLHNKKIIMLLSIIVISLLFASIIIMNNNGRTEVSGTLFIDSVTSPSGVDVKIVFSDEELIDTDGTDEKGRYSIDITGFENKLGTFVISYNGTEYDAQNFTGESIGTVFFDSIETLEFDLYINTININLNGETNESTDDELDNETHDGNTTENETIDDYDDTNSTDENDNSSDDGSDSSSGGFFPSGGGSGSSGGSSGNSGDDDDDDQNTEEDEFTIIASASTGGMISPNGSITVTIGDYLNFTITPDVDHYISDVLIDTVSHGDISYYNFSSINDDHEIHVEFKEINQPPILSDAYPNNENANYNPRLEINIEDSLNDDLTVIFRTIKNNTWTTINTQIGKSGVYTQHTQDMEIKNQVYIWSINVTDGEFWINQSYSFVAQPFVLKWVIDTAPVNTVGPVAVDVNDDGIYEVFLTGEEKIICVNGSTGEINWEYYDDQIMHHTIPVIEDLNNDGIEEIVMSCEFTQAGVTGKTIAIHANNGSLYWRVDAPSDHRHLVVIDVDGTGFPYVFVCSHINSEGALRKLRGTDGETLAMVNIYYPCHGGLSYEDLDDDGNFELLLGDYNNEPGKGIHCYDPVDLTLKWFERARADPQVPVVADVNKDGILDIVTGYGGVYVIDGSTGTRMTGKWGSERFPSHSPVTVYDIDLDGNLEVLICREGSNVTVFDLERWEVDTILEEGAEEPPFFADVIGDGELEIISTKLVYNQGIVIYNSTYDVVETINRAANRWTCVQDIDNDGQNEFLFTIGGEGMLYAYETSAYTPEQHVRTHMYGYSERQTGAAVYVRPPGAPQPIIRDEFPVNNSVDVLVNPELSVRVIDFHYALMNVSISTNASGSWETIATFTDVGNGWYNVTTTNMNQVDTTYYWKVSSVDPYADNITSTQLFSFRTSTKPRILDLNVSDSIAYQNEEVNILSTISDESKIEEIQVIIEDPDGLIENVSMYKHQWTTLTYDDFESGWGNYVSGGDDCSLYTDGGKLTQDGEAAANIQDDSGENSSFYLNTSIELDTLGYTAITIDFWMTGYGMNDGHDYFLEYFDGSSWHQIKRYEQNRGSFAPEVYTDSYYKFANWLFFHDRVWINESDFAFSDSANIRFRCDSSKDADDVYIDLIYINATYAESTPFTLNQRFDKIGTYNYSIWCKDILGNTNISEIKQFTIIEDVDTPSINEVNSTPNETIQGALLTIRTNVTDNAGLGDVRVNITSPDSTNTNESIIDNLMGPDQYQLIQKYYEVGTYSYHIWVNDLNGYQNKSDIYTFNITDAPPVQFNETPADNSIDILLDPILSVELIDYSYEDIHYIIKSNSTGSWITLDEDIVSGGSGVININTSNMNNYSSIYFWSVNITDGDDWNNQTYTFTTEPPDTTSPIISNVMASPTIQPLGEYINISCNVSDNKNVNVVKVNITYPSGTNINQTMTLGYFYNQTFPEIGSYSYYIWANDSSNNSGVSENETFDISADAAPVIIDNTNDTAITGEEFEMNVTILDGDNITFVQIEYQFDSNPPIADTMMRNGTNWRVIFTVPINTSLIYYNVSTQDNYGFENNTGLKQVTVIDIIEPLLIDNTPTSLARTGDLLTINATVSDNIIVSNVSLTYWFGTNLSTTINLNRLNNTDYFTNVLSIPVDSLDTLHYNITAIDDANNENKTIIKNISIIDDDVPIIENISISIINNSINISCNVTDNISIDEVNINISGSNNSTENISMIHFENNLYFYNETKTSGLYTYFIFATDTSNNTNRTINDQFEIL